MEKKESANRQVKGGLSRPRLPGTGGSCSSNSGRANPKFQIPNPRGLGQARARGQRSAPAPGSRDLGAFTPRGQGKRGENLAHAHSLPKKQVLFITKRCKENCFQTRRNINNHHHHQKTNQQQTKTHPTITNKTKQTKTTK